MQFVLEHYRKYEKNTKKEYPKAVVIIMIRLRFGADSHSTRFDRRSTVARRPILVDRKYRVWQKLDPFYFNNFIIFTFYFDNFWHRYLKAFAKKQ